MSYVMAKEYTTQVRGHMTVIKAGTTVRMCPHGDYIVTDTSRMIIYPMFGCRMAFRTECEIKRSIRAEGIHVPPSVVDKES